MPRVPFKKSLVPSWGAVLCSVMPGVLLFTAIAGAIAVHSSTGSAQDPAPSAAGECLYGASLEVRLADAWRRWGLEGERMRDCDAEALQDALEIVQRCDELRSR